MSEQQLEKERLRGIRWRQEAFDEVLRFYTEDRDCKLTPGLLKDIIQLGTQLLNVEKKEEK